MTHPDYPAEVLARAAGIRLIGFDVDGTLTDGGLSFDSEGRESKRFHVQDGMGMVLLERSKLACLQRIAAELAIDMEAVAFMGDDLPDLAALRGVGLALAPADAHACALQAAHWVTPRRAGNGAVRDVCDLLLQAQGKLAAILAHGEHP